LGTDGRLVDTVAFGASKLMGERLGKCFADIYGISFIGVRIGHCRAGEYSPSDIPEDRPHWFKMMYLSHRDFYRLMDRCIEADDSISFALVNGVSANTGSQWDID